METATATAAVMATVAVTDKAADCKKVQYLVGGAINMSVVRNLFLRQYLLYY
jgi:hypothetical protein